MPEQPSTAGRIDTMFDMQKLQLKGTLLIRSQGSESALVAPVHTPSSDCTLRDSAAMLSTNSYVGYAFLLRGM